MQPTSLFIAEKFRGPPTSGNGGYVAGIIAAALSEREAVEVTLRAPTPLDVALNVRRSDGALTVTHEATLIAEAKCASMQMDVPTPVTWEEALAAREHSYSYPLGLNSLFSPPRRGVHPTCFCCGIELAPTDGTHVYSAPIAGRAQVAAAWIANACWGDANGFVRPEIMWTALDCPGQMAWRAEGTKTGMLGRITARIERPLRVGERSVVIGWTMGSEGKKFFAGTALFDAAGTMCAYAKAVWIGKW